MKIFILGRQKPVALLTCCTWTLSRRRGHLTAIIIEDKTQRLSTSEKLNLNYHFLITGKRKGRILAKREKLNTYEEGEQVREAEKFT